VDRPRERAAVRDEPFAHAYEMVNRALAAGSRAVGARVAFDGVGGDQLFQVSNVYFADLFRTLRWRALAREWRAKRMSGRGARTFFRWAVQPTLPDVMLHVAALLRGGRPLRGILERPVPPWMDSAFVRRHGLLERERQHTPRRTGGSPADHETMWYLTHPYFPRVFACVAAFALEAGADASSHSPPAVRGRTAPRAPRRSGSCGRRCAASSLSTYWRRARTGPGCPDITSTGRSASCTRQSFRKPSTNLSRWSD
jgi:hypothetical protein